MSTTDVVLREEEQAARGFELAERIFTPERRAAVAKFLNIAEDDPAFVPYLAVAAGLGLNPILGEIWLIPQRMKTKVRDGNVERDVWVDKYKPAVGRDGFLKKARETKGKPGGYKGMQFGVVHERDSFEVQYTGDEMRDPKVLHSFASKPTAFEQGDDPTAYRGRIIGAWCKVYVDGEPPTFYFANLREHGKTRFDEQTQKMVWSGSWSYTSTMVLKSAQSYALRIALGITGVVPVDELRADRLDGEDTPSGGIREEESFDWTQVDDEDLRERLQAAVGEANALDHSWPVAKCEMVLVGRDEEELTKLAEQIEHENELKRVTDAEVVDEPEAGPPPEKLDELRTAEYDLTESLAVAQDAEEESRIRAQLEQVRAEIRQLGGAAPGQDKLDGAE